MNGIKKPESAGVTYFDLHSWEFSDSRTQEGCHTLVKMPCWLALLLGPLMGLAYLVCTPLVFMGALCAALGCRCKQEASRRTQDIHDNQEINREDRELADQVIEEIEKQFANRRSLK